jgi:hypothetical protein
VLAVILLIVVVATSLIDGKLIPDFAALSSRVNPGGNRQPDGDHLRTGSILITPGQGNICEHRLIDNETWRIRSNGTIQCDEAVAWHADRGDVTWTSRIEAIRDGFFPKR